jgi:hypothetical protein
MNWAFLWGSLVVGSCVVGIVLLIWFACWSSYTLAEKIMGKPNLGIGLVLYFLQLFLYAGIIGAVVTGDWNG